MSEIPVQSQLTPLVNTVARIIAIMNNKGGAGKTSTITNLSMSLAHAGRRVLLIDGDQQANSTEVMANGKKYYAQYSLTICDLYNNPRFSIFDAIIPAVSGEEVIDNLYIILFSKKLYIKRSCNTELFCYLFSYFLNSSSSFNI